MRRGATIAFDLGEVDGKIRTGVYDRFATVGYKQKDGSPADFTPENLSAFARNWYARGQRLPMCLDHTSALQGMVPAPAAAFYDALAVVSDGKVVEFKKLARSLAEPPDVAQLAQQVMRFSTDDNPKPTSDGLWGHRCEVTPLGEHPTMGLRNYRGVSPLFVMEGTDEQEQPIGPVLFDVAAVNTNFQGGCELALNAVSGAFTSGTGTGYVPPTDDGSRLVSSAPDKNGAELRLGDSYYRRDGRGPYQIHTIKTDSRTGKTYVIGYNDLDSSVSGGINSRTVTKMTRISMATGVKVGDTVDVGGREWEVAAISGTGRNRKYTLASLSSSETTTIDEQWMQDGARVTSRWSATTGAARAFGENMTPDLMSKMGLAEGCSPADKMAAYQRYAYDASDDEIKAMADDLDGSDDEKAKAMAAKMRRMAAQSDPPPPAAMGDDKDEAQAMTALASKLNLVGATRKEILMAANASHVPPQQFAALVEAKAREVVTAEMEKAKNDAKVASLVEQARSVQYPDPDALQAFAKFNYAGAEKLLKPYLERSAVLTSRIAPLANTRGTSGTSEPVVERNGRVRFGMDLSSAIKAFRAKNPNVSFVDATDAVLKENPQLADGYYQHLNGR